MSPQNEDSVDIASFEKKTLEQLRAIARDWNITDYSRLKKDDLIIRLLRANAEKHNLELRGGVLEILDDGIGFLRSDHFLPGDDDIYVSQSQIRRFGLRTGDMVIGQVRAPKESEKYYGLIRVEAVNGIDPEIAKRRPSFESLTPIFPTERFDLETDRHTHATRLLNLIAPIGKGQRGLIVSPPKAGKTT
ncbi:MAG: Rho termination factor N-terminal domain-containing protein, partial [Chloroflexota bacterium]